MTSKVEPGCLAMIIKGSSTGAVVAVTRACTPTDYEWISKHRRVKQVWWHCEGKVKVNRAEDNKEEEVKTSFWPENYLMRIDGKFDETDADICDDLDNYHDLRSLRVK